jgi:hypothetical protein
LFCLELRRQLRRRIARTILMPPSTWDLATALWWTVTSSSAPAGTNASVVALSKRTGEVLKANRLLTSAVRSPVISDAGDSGIRCLRQ